MATPIYAGGARRGFAPQVNPRAVTPSVAINAPSNPVTQLVSRALQGGPNQFIANYGGLPVREMGGPNIPDLDRQGTGQSNEQLARQIAQVTSILGAVTGNQSLQRTAGTLQLGANIARDPVSGTAGAIAPMAAARLGIPNPVTGAALTGLNLAYGSPNATGEGIAKASGVSALNSAIGANPVGLVSQLASQAIFGTPVVQALMNLFDPDARMRAAPVENREVPALNREFAISTKGQLTAPVEERRLFDAADLANRTDAPAPVEERAIREFRAFTAADLADRTDLPAPVYERVFREVRTPEVREIRTQPPAPVVERSFSRF